MVVEGQPNISGAVAQAQVEQVRDRGEHLIGDLAQGVEQESIAAYAASWVNPGQLWIAT
jgi:hypothetical protein